MADMAYREVYAMNPIEARMLLIRTYQETGSISETARPVKYFDLFHGARLWHTSRQAQRELSRAVVRKWVRRFQEEGEEGLKDHSRRPLHSPRQTSPEIEKRVSEARKATGCGRERLALYLQRGV